MGVKMNFIVNNRLNQDLKQKAVGPLFFKRNSTCARFTFFGFGLGPLYAAAQPVVVYYPKKNFAL